MFGPYFTLVVFLIAAFVAVGREFWMARGLDKAYPLGRVSLAVPIAVFGAEHLTSPHDDHENRPGVDARQALLDLFRWCSPDRRGPQLYFSGWDSLIGDAPRNHVLLLRGDDGPPRCHRRAANRIAWTLFARESAFGAGAILLAITSGARKRTPGENRVAIGALYWIALVSMFYGIEHFLHPECVPAVPLEKVTPLWIPLAHFWTVLTGIVMVIGAGAMFVRNVARQSAAALGGWVVLLVVSLYLAIMISKPDIEGLNYFADTLMFGGVLLVASCAYDIPRKSRTS